MTVQALLNEYGFEIDDIRWYLAGVVTERLLSRKEKPEEITRLIWSGELEKELYDMEERYLRNLQSDLDRCLTDEAKARETFNQIARVKKKRRTAG